MFRRLLEKLSKYRWRLLAAVALSPLMLLGLTNFWVLNAGGPYLFKEEPPLPNNDVALVLGTSKYNGYGGINPHFQGRMEAAARLYRDGKVRHLLLSGSNQNRYYDEPTDMKKWLMEAGVPETAMTLDYAGMRTLDSVVRAREIFGQRKITVVTDEFHAYRALFLCQRYGIDAVAFAGRDVPFSATVKTRFREYGARCKAVLDVYLLDTQPKYLGETVKIKIE
jgi:SanA protein